MGMIEQYEWTVNNLTLLGDMRSIEGDAEAEALLFPLGTCPFTARAHDPLTASAEQVFPS